jgi:hypothetical protein
MPAKANSDMPGQQSFLAPRASQSQCKAVAPFNCPKAKAEIVQTACAACHSLGNITNSGHSPEEWKTTVAMMLNVGANVPKDKVGTVLNYLIKNFPSPRRRQ